MRDRPYFERLAVRCFVFVPAAYLVLGAALLALGDRTPPGVLALLIVASAASLLTGALLRLTPKLLPVVIPLGIVIAFVGLAAGSFGLAHPDSFFDFMTPLVTIAGALAGVVASSIAGVQRLRHTTRASRPLVSVVVRIGLAALLATSVLSVVLTRAHRTHAGAPAGAIVVDMRTDAYKPRTIRLKAGERAHIFVRNLDSYAHTFTIDSLHVDLYVGPRAHRLVEFDVPSSATGRHDLMCSVVGHFDMSGDVYVS